MNPFIRLGRHSNAIFMVGFTGVFAYKKYSNYENCKKMLESRKDDPTLNLPAPLTKLVNEVMNDMKLEESERNKIRFYLSETADFVHYGTVHDKEGAVFGVPQYFAIPKGADIKVSTLDEKKKLVDVKKHASLTEALSLSLEAQKFAIARELYELLNPNLKGIYFYPSFGALQCLLFSYVIEKYNVRIRHKQSLIIHFAIYMMAASIYALAFDSAIFYTETNADLLAGNLGKTYAKGGIEYYTKMIEKNKALKRIDNNAPYSNDGDINFSLFGKHHMPLSKRVQFLKNQLDGIQDTAIWKYVLMAYF